MSLFRVRGTISPPKSLIISGGGTKGLIAIGILRRLYDENYRFFDSTTCFRGTSIGSVITLLICLGFSLDEIYSIIAEKLIPVIVANIILLIFPKNILLKVIQKYYGIVNIHKVFYVIEDEIYKKLGTIPTLKEIYILYHKNYMCTGYNLTKSKTVYFSAENYPDMQCTEAVKISCLVPGLFQTYEYAGDYYIDGGVSDNFPIENVKSGLGINLSSTKRKCKEAKFCIIEYTGSFMACEIRKEEFQRFLFEGYSFR